MGWRRVLEKKIIPDSGEKATKSGSGSATLKHRQFKLYLNLSNGLVLLVNICVWSHTGGSPPASSIFCDTYRTAGETSRPCGGTTWTSPGGDVEKSWDEDILGVICQICRREFPSRLKAAHHVHADHAVQVCIYMRSTRSDLLDNVGMLKKVSFKDLAYIPYWWWPCQKIAWNSCLFKINCFQVMSPCALVSQHTLYICTPANSNPSRDPVP